MKNVLFFLALLVFTNTWAQLSVSPATFDVTDEITITVDANSTETDCNGFNNPTSVYMHSGIGNDANPWGFDVVGNWGQNDGIGQMTSNGDGTWSITITPSEYYDLTATELEQATIMGLVFRNGSGNQELKNDGCSDFFINVGLFQLNLINPEENSITLVNEGQNVTITATTSQTANYTLKANDAVVHTQSATTSYSHNYVVNETSQMELTATSANGSSQTKTFTLMVAPDVETAPKPAWIQQGINYTTDATHAGLALWAPGKDFVHVIGDFNNWTVDDNYLMKRDANNSDLFWIELTNLTPQQMYAFQYRTSDARVVADPYSPIILSSYDDQWIPESVFPNLPDYPTGQDFEASIIQTNQAAYNWTVSDFNKPEKDNLMVYELLLRDFTNEKDWESLIARIGYLKNLNINAVELMPIMEFDGNNSWGYNPSFHYALDKTYGTADKFKEFVDVCHQNGIAVILDIALNHATGRSPLVRLWNNDPDGDGYGSVANDNPYFNTIARHTYGVFEDFNHSTTATRYYVQRVIQHWIQEYKIDGFRWDLTKGFTQNCTSTDEGCTNSYQQDRVDVLKMYADYQWAADPTSYVIFEHLGTANEEQQWANYRINEGKGVIMWANVNHAYNQLTMGYNSENNFNYVAHNYHGFTGKRAMGYGESHDEERLMYKNLQYGASSGSYNVRNLETALERQEAFGAVFFTIPGPKMIWQFGELGYDFGINRCEDGSYNNNCRTSPKPVAFNLGYNTESDRTAVYETWSRLLEIRLANEVFDTNTFNIESGSLLPKIYVWDTNLPSSQLNSVIVVANFNTTTSLVTPNFPTTGMWYNLMNNSSYNVTSTNQTVTLQPGEFRIFGNQPSENLATNNLELNSNFGFRIKNNPVRDGKILIEYNTAKPAEFTLYDLNGKLLRKITATQDSHELEILANQNNGLYILVMRAGNELTSEKLIIK